MFPPDPAQAIKHIVIATLEELEDRSPGFLDAVQARLNSAEKAPETTEFADRGEAAAIIRDLCSKR